MRNSYKIITLILLLCFFISIFLLSTFDGRLLAGKEELKCGVLTHDMSAPGIEREGNKIRVYSSIIKKDLRIWADIPESFRQDIELKWYNISLREGIRYVDKNDNGLIDRLEWVLDELKGQEEFEINISPKEDVRRIVLKTTADFDEIKQTGLSNFVYSDYLNAYIGLVENRNIKNLANLKDVRIELDEAMHIMLQDTLPLIGADIVHKKVIDGQNLTGQNISVCVIDTGVYPHPDFANRIIAQHCFADDSIPGNGVGYCPNGQEEDENATDDNGHGTRVAGIVAANGGIKGVAPAASIVAVKVCNSGGQCYTSDIAKGIDWCRQHKDEYNIDIITISLGTWNVYPDRESCAASTNTTITPAVDAAHADGIFIDAASGNSYSINGLSNPACLANVTSVAASYKDDIVTYYSNVHPTMLDIVAPGNAINSTKMPNTYGTGSGTSFAAPHIAGVAAILQQQSRLMNNRTLTPDELRDLLKKTGKPVPDNYSMARTGLMFPRVQFDIASDIMLKIDYEAKAFFNTFGKVRYDLLPNLDGLESCFIVKYNNITLLNRSECQKFNQSSELSFFGLPFQFMPVILKDGQVCIDCVPISYDEGNFAFNISGFSSYTTIDNSILDVWSPGGSVGGLTPFYANYSYRINSTPVEDAECQLEFNNTNYTMVYTSGLWKYELAIERPGIYSFMVYCNSTSAESQNKNGYTDVKPMIITVCDSGCNYSNLTDALHNFNDSEVSFYINSAGLWELDGLGYHLSMKLDYPVIVFNTTSVAVDCHGSMIWNEFSNGTLIYSENGGDISNCIINDYKKAIWASGNVKVQNCNISSGEIGVYVFDGELNASQNVFENLDYGIRAVNSNLSEDIYNENVFYDNIIDVSKAWDVQVNVISNEGPVDNASVTVYFDDALEWSGFTNQSGWTQPFVLEEWIISNGTLQNKTSYKIGAYKEFIGNYDEIFLIDHERTIRSSEPIILNISQCIRLGPISIVGTNTSKRICRGNYYLTAKVYSDRFVNINGNNLDVDCDFSNITAIFDPNDPWEPVIFWVDGTNVTLKNCNIYNHPYLLSTTGTYNIFINNRLWRNIGQGQFKIDWGAKNISIINNTLENVSVGVSYVIPTPHNITFIGNNATYSGYLNLRALEGLIAENIIIGTTLLTDNGTIYNNTFISAQLQGKYDRIVNNMFVNSSVIGQDVFYNIFENSVFYGYYSGIKNISHNLFYGYLSGSRIAIDVYTSSAFIFNNTINDSWTAIEIDSNSTVIGNKIYNSSFSGIRTFRYGSNNTIKDNIIDNSGSCIDLNYVTYGNNTLLNNNLSNCDYGIRFFKNTTVIGNKINNANISIFGKGWGNELAFIDGNILENSGYGIILADINYNSNISETNQIYDTVNDRRLVINWTLTVWIKDHLGNPIENATVTVYEFNKTDPLSELITDDTGSVGWFLTQYYIDNENVQHNLTPHKVVANYKGIENQTQILLNRNYGREEAANRIYIYLTPNASFTWTPLTPEEGKPVNFTDLSKIFYNATWQWNLGDGNFSFEQNVSHVYSQNGTYTICLNVTDVYNFSSVFCQNITILDSIPIPDFYWHPQSPQKGQIVIFNASNSTGWDKPFVYSWNFGDGSLLHTSNETVQHTYQNSGTYTVILNIRDSDGSIANITKNITVTEPSYQRPAAPGGGYIPPTEEIEEVIVVPKIYEFSYIQGKEIYLNISDIVVFNDTNMTLIAVSNQTVTIEFDGQSYILSFGENQIDIDNDGIADIDINLKSVFETGAIMIFQSIPKLPITENVTENVTEPSPTPAIPSIAWIVLTVIFIAIFTILFLGKYKILKQKII